MSRSPGEELPFALPEKFARADGGALRPLIDRSCLHGGPPPQAAATTALRCPLVTGCLELLSAEDCKILERHKNDDTQLGDLNDERWAAMLRTLETFWSHPERSRHVDQSFSKLCFSLATDATLDGNFLIARQCMQIGLFLREWARLGGTAVRRALHSTTESEFIRGWNSALHRTRTDRGMVLYLSRHMPCYRLEAMAQEAAATPKAAKCWYCKKQDEAAKIQKCSGCKTAEYCSRDCQVADWKVSQERVSVDSGVNEWLSNTVALGVLLL